MVKGGREATGLDAVAWAERAVDLGAGELLVTSIDRDGTAPGFDTALLRAITSRVCVPVIASGGAAGPDDFVAAVRDGGADAVLAASIFHRRIHAIAEVKAAMAAPACRSGSSRRPSHDGTIDPGAVRFGPDGLVPAVVQDVRDGRVLMVAYMDAEALAATIATGEVHSTPARATGCGARARRAATCCASSISRPTATATRCSWRVEPAGPTCHRGTRSCFDPEAPRRRDDPGLRLAREAVDTIASGAPRPAGSYTARLLDGGVDAVGPKGHGGGDRGAARRQGRRRRRARG